MSSNGDELHELFQGRLKIFQRKRGYRFSLDTILLSHFVASRASGKIADLGTGCGVIPVIIAKAKRVKEIFGIEVQTELAELAKKNICFNQCDHKVSILQADIRDLKRTFLSGEFDLVVSNPPYYALTSGRINPQHQRAIARHEVYGSLTDFITITSYLLRALGKFITIYPCSRLLDLLKEMLNNGLEPKTLQFVHPNKGEPATMVLVEGVKGGGREVKILPALMVCNAQGNYTEQIKTIFRQI